ncbi:MAG: D-alanyl-D-alanine carboxypeptidase [Proteobacteria bacterium]|nr:D-alanyl-D-alanine carboxypeptidase [Pseudomonadota bacterium]
MVFLNPSNAHANNFAYMIVDGQSGKVMASHRADELRPPASLTKIMTLYLIFEAIQNGKINLTTRFSVSKRATEQEPCNLWLKMGSTISVKDIIYALVTRSANDMSVTIAEGLSGSVEKFSELMNQKAKELGMTRTKFYNPTGLPDRRQVTTAKDMMTLARALHKNFPKEYAYFKTKTFSFNGKPIRNHNRMLNSFTGCDGIKTGFTFASRFNISVSAQRIAADGKPIRVFAVVLGGQTSVSRDKKTAELMEKAFKKLHATPRMQEVVATQDDVAEADQIDQLVEETEVAEVNEHIQELSQPVQSLPKANNRRSRKNSKAKPRQVKPSPVVKPSQISVSLSDPIEEIIKNPLNVDINRYLPAGWVKAKPNFKSS